LNIFYHIYKLSYGERRLSEEFCKTLVRSETTVAKRNFCEITTGRKITMKKTLMIMSVVGFSISIGALAAATEVDAPDCDAAGLTGDAWNLCQAYCAAQNCDEISSPGCDAVKMNYVRETGVPYLPCDTVACGVCAILDPVTEAGTVGICNEIKAVDCAEPLQNYGEVTCEEVTLPLPGGAPGCDNTQPGPFGTFIPDCQYVGGLAWVCTRFLGGTPIPEACPAPPVCTEDQLDDLNMPRP
jgi:hypothetical protein